MKTNMKESVPCDRQALSQAINKGKLSGPAKRIGQYMVDMIGYEYSIMIFQLKKALDMPVEIIEDSLDELIAFGFVRQQARIEPRRTYILDKAFLEAKENVATEFAHKDEIADPKRPRLQLILGGKK